MMPSAIATLVAVTLTMLIAWAFTAYEEVNEAEAREELEAALAFDNEIVIHVQRLDGREDLLRFQAEPHELQTLLTAFEGFDVGQPTSILYARGVAALAAYRAQHGDDDGMVCDARR